jgi:hypothetical protein
MTTAAEIKALIKPFADAQQDVALYPRMLVLRPARHFLSFVYFERLLDKRRVSPVWGVQSLFHPQTQHIPYWTHRLGRQSIGLWYIDDPHIEKTLFEEIDQTALSKLRSIRTIFDFRDFVSETEFGHHITEWPHNRFILEAALGRFDTARDIWVSELSNWTERHHRYYDGNMKNMSRRQAFGACLMQDDRAGVARLLNEFEALSVKNLKLEKIWECTPFPCEL